jgi:hypothetical protein
MSPPIVRCASESWRNLPPAADLWLYGDELPPYLQAPEPGPDPAPVVLEADNPEESLRGASAHMPLAPSVQPEPLNSAHVRLPSINWKEDWALVQEPERPIMPPLVWAGRSVALVGPPKSGKSLLSLELSAAAAAGRAVLGGPSLPPIRVLYLDFENTRTDVIRRLGAMDFEPAELQNLIYASFPPLAPLGTALGAKVLLATVDAVQPALVVIDTLIRAVEGDENDARTIADFYRHTGMPLKERGIALMRLDHTGKHPAYGARGSSAKNDDVDDVWLLRNASQHLVLERTHSRSGHGPSALTLRREAEPLRHVPLSGPDAQRLHRTLETAASKDLAAVLDELRVPATAGRPTAEAALREAGHGYSKPDLERAIRERKARAQSSST